MKKAWHKIGVIIFILLTLSVLAFLGCFKLKTPVRPLFTFADFCSRVNPDGYIDLYGDRSIGQEITFKFDYLSKIGFFIEDEGKYADAHLFLRIKEFPGGSRDILTLSVKASDLLGNYYPFLLPEVSLRRGASIFFFQFPPLKFPTGKKLYILLESPDSGPENGIKIGYYNNRYDRGFAGGSAYLNGVPWDRYPAFLTYNWWDADVGMTFKQIMHKMALDRGFTRFYSILCLLLISGVYFTSRPLRK